MSSAAFRTSSSTVGDDVFSRFVEGSRCIAIAVAVIRYECKQYNNVVDEETECEVMSR